MRRAFNFFNSYWCIANELSDKDRLQFYDALMLYEFTGDKSKIDALTGMAKFAYVSQAHSIDSQINGYLDVCKRHGNKPFEDPTLPPTVGGVLGANLQEKEEGKEKEKEKEENNTRPLKESIDYVKLLKFINDNTNRKYQLINNTVRRKFEARLREGYKKEQITNAITNAVKVQIHKDNGFQHLTPEFFSRSSTLDRYGYEVSKQELTPEEELKRLKKERGYHVE